MTSPTISPHPEIHLMSDEQAAEWLAARPAWDALWQAIHEETMATGMPPEADTAADERGLDETVP